MKAVPPTRSAGSLMVQGPNIKAGATADGTRSSTKGMVNLGPLTKKEFGHACGDHGLEYSGTIVSRVASQAKKLGVRPGWKIHEIDGHSVSSDEDIFLRLQEAKWQWRSCFVWFVTDMAAIRAEQARQRQASIQAEMERLAKLPFEGAHDKGHQIQLREGFSFQGYVDRAEERAMTLAQLRHCLRWCEDHCHRWRDMQSKGVSRTAGQKLSPQILNMHHINHWLIQPATKAKECSFLEMLTAQKQPPGWFVTHWWGERFEDFVKCIEVHEATRKLGDKACWWVGAFAARQHQLQDDDDPTKSFMRAMAKAQYRVLLTLDGKTHIAGPATPFTRLWCGFEVFSSLDKQTSSLDIAACIDSKATIITKGLTDEELEWERSEPGRGHRAKLERERVFDPELLLSGMSMKVQHGQAGEQLDRNRILNSIVGRDAAERSAPAPEEHELYTRANRRIAAALALTGWKRVMTNTHSDAQTLQTKFQEAIRADTWRKSLDIGLAYATHFEEKVLIMMRALPTGLRELHLDLRSTTINDEKLVALAASLPPGLEELTVDLSHNQHINNQGIMSFTEKLPPKVSSQSISVEGTSVTKELAQKVSSLERVRQFIYEEAQKGALCSLMSLLPTKTGRMQQQVDRCKLQC